MNASGSDHVTTSTSNIQTIRNPARRVAHLKGGVEIQMASLAREHRQCFRQLAVGFLELSQACFACFSVNVQNEDSARASSRHAVVSFRSILEELTYFIAIICAASLVRS